MSPTWQLPAKKYILIYSLAGSLLTTIIPITVAIDHLQSQHFLLRLADITLLFFITSLVFYISFLLNLRFYKLNIFRRLTINIAAFGLLSFLSISVHLPVWKVTTHIPVIFYFRDEIIRNLTIFIVSSLAARYYYNNVEIQMVKLLNSELKNENLTNQVNGLMQQINPHFFFNSLNTLSGLVQENPEKSEVFISKLSQVFRYVLKMQENSRALLADELNFAEDYFYLLKMRFEDKINLTINIDDNRHQMVPSLCTQLLIENVIKHNRMSRQMPVDIQISIEDGFLVVCNTWFPQQSNASTGLGLTNLNKRSELLCGKPIEIKKSQNLFCVKVPMLKS